ncbi:chorismate mutase, partial [Vibrio parahaemolyticus AQ3810]
AKL